MATGNNDKTGNDYTSYYALFHFAFFNAKNRHCRPGLERKSSVEINGYSLHHSVSLKRFRKEIGSPKELEVSQTKVEVLRWEE